MSDLQNTNEVEIIPTKTVIFTDLDGTLLDHTTYDHTQALPALDRAQKEEIPVIPVTSKTWAEVGKIRQDIEAMKNCPAVVENGGGIVIPKSFIQLLPPDIEQQNQIVEIGDNWMLQIAKPIEEARKALREMTQQVGVQIESFGDMTPEEFSNITGLTIENARLALQRQFQEGFRLINQPTNQDDLHELANKMTSALNQKGFNLTQGGRFWQVTGGTEKGKAVEVLKKILEIKYGKIHTVGLGDAEGDLPALSACDEGFLVANPHKMKQIDLTSYPHVVAISKPGPEGWNEAVNATLDRIAAE